MRKSSRGRYFFLVTGVLVLVYGVGLWMCGKGADMIHIWLILGAFFAVLSVKKIYVFILSRVWTKAVLAGGFTAVAIFAVIIVVCGSRHMPDTSSDYIIVLGAQVEGKIPSQTLQYRLETAYKYLITYEDSKAILSGSQGENEGVTEAKAMYNYLFARGIEEDRLIMEDQSTNTYENLRNSFALLENADDLKICVITSDFHMLRAKMLAQKLGCQVSGWGAETPLPLVPNHYVREMLAIVKDLIIH